MPSGMTEVNTLQHVMKRAADEMSLEYAEEDEDEGIILYPVRDMCLTFFSMRYDIILTYAENWKVR